MIKLKKSLTQCLLDAYYTFMAENSLVRFDCLIDLGYLDEPLRKVLEKSPQYRGDGTILLNLSVNACRRINYSGDAFTGEIALLGVPTQLYIPFEAFVAIAVPLSEDTTVQSDFPIYDRLVFDAKNPQWIHPYNEVSNSALLTISPEAIVKWMHANGHEDASVSTVMDFVKFVWPTGIPAEVQEYLVEETANILRERMTSVQAKPTSQPKPSNIATVEPVAEVVDKPLLDFPDMAKPQPVMLQSTTPSKYTGRPKLTVIKGGKS